MNSKGGAFALAAYAAGFGRCVLRLRSGAGRGGFRAVERKSPLRRNITPQDVGGAAAWLLSDLAKMVTSELIHVDSGMSVMNP